MSEKYKTYPIEIDGAGESTTTTEKLGKALFGSKDKTLNFEARIRGQLDAIIAARSGVGQTVLGAIDKKKLIRIIPYVGSDSEERLKDRAKEKKWADSAWQCNATGGRPDGLWAEVCDAVTSDGTKSLVFFSPEMWMAGGACNSATQVGAGVDEVLFHELLHAYNQTDGKREQFQKLKIAEGGEQLYDDIAEFFAIVITNMYMSEKNATALRAHHHGFTPLPAKWKTSEGFITDENNRKWLKHVMTHEPGLCMGLIFTCAGVPFNPFKAYSDTYGYTPL